MTDLTSVLAVDSINVPSISYTGIAPILIILAAACIGILVEAFVPQEARYPSQVGLALVSCATAFVWVVAIRDRNELTIARALAIDGPALFSQGSLLIFGFLAVVLFADRTLDSAGSVFVAEAALPVGSKTDRELLTSTKVQTEVFPLAMFALSGMMIFVASNNLLVMFVALEVLSLPLYLMAGLSRRRRLLSQEAAVKYFLLGAFASGFFIYGLALVYGYAGSIDLRGIFEAQTESTSNDSLLLIAMALLVIGLLFKAGAAPFHSWTPDVYQGSPTPVTAFMAAATKLAAFVAIIRLLYVGFGATPAIWQPLVYSVAIVTMIVGAVLGLTQTDIKRMLAYSSVAHAGFILIGLVGNSVGGTGGVLFYLFTYGITSIGAFAVVTLVRRADGEAGTMNDWKGLARRSPLTAAVMTVFMLALTGIPLTSGFTGKFVVFSAAIGGGFGWLVVIALVLSAVTAVFYLRLVVLMYFQEPEHDGPTVAVPGTATFLLIGVCAAITLLLGIVPGPIIDLANAASIFVA